MFAEVAVSTGEPGEVAAGVEDEIEGLGRGTKAERNGVSSIAMGEEGGCGGVGRVGSGIFEVVGSG